MRVNHPDTFDAEGSGSSASRKAVKRVGALKAFVVAEQAHLLERHRFGLGGREIARGRADLVDLVVSRASRSVAQDLGPGARDELSACAIVALGGYGRRELSPESDVDVLLLYPEDLTAARRAFVESVLRLLWDVGLEVGHSVRSIEDCVDLGRSDLHSRNAMSEARLVAGNPELYGTFTREMGASVYRDDRANKFFLEAMRAEVAERRARYGAVVGLLEPNLKEGAGGLRDLHVMGWFGLARYGLIQLDDLVRADVLSPTEYRQALRASDVLLRIRNEAHFQTGRRADVLSVELQPAIAQAMGYSDRHFATAAELFMRDLYRRTEELRRVSEAFLVRSDFWSPPPRKFLLRWSKTVQGGSGQRYRIRDRELFALPDQEGHRRDALQLFEVFRVAQRQGVGVSSELREQVRARLGTVDRLVRSSPDTADAFLEILREGRAVGLALRSMHDSGLLARYLPEFRRITFMVQHDHYHRYTIDEHTLRVVETLDRLPQAEDSILALLQDAYERVEDRGVLTLSTLLHDIGKGRGAGPDHATRGAAIAKRVARRIGFSEEKIEDVAFLVTKHLVMSRTAQRRDLTDESLVRGFADTVGTEDRLNMLFVLTYADISGVAPTAWNEWKATLLNELYLKTLPIVRSRHGAEPVRETRPALEDRVLRQLSPEFLVSDVEEFLGHLPTRYRRVLPPGIIARHFDLVRELGSRSAVTDWRDSKKGPYTVLSVCARDAPGLLGLLAGALTGAGLDILSLDVFTRDDGIALDVFRVCEAMGARPVQRVPEELREAATRALTAAAAGELDPAASVERQRTRQTRRKRSRVAKPAEVRFEPVDALGRTPIEVRVDDEPGVLYRISSTLSALGLNISFAKVATEKNQALDVFYVERTDLGPVDVAEHGTIREALLDALQGDRGRSAAQGAS